MTKKTAKQDLPESIQYLQRPDLPFDDGSLAEPGQKVAAPVVDQAAQMAELSAKIKQMEEANATLQRTNMALMGQPVQTTPQFGPTEFDTKGLPDPVADPEGYARETFKRAESVLANRGAIQQHQNKQIEDLQRKVNNVWEQFGTQYADYAANTDLVEAAAQKAVAAAKDQGMDPNRYMFSATPAFFKDVVGILDGWGVGKKAEEEDDQTVQRTSGIPGGLESGGALTKGKDPDDERIPTLMEELRGWKQKTGFYA